MNINTLHYGQLLVASSSMRLFIIMIFLYGNVTAQTILIAEKGTITVKQHSDTAAFQIGSVSKTFTAAAVLQLEEKGKIRLNDPFVKYFPSFPYPDVTIYHLLTHTSGLPDKEEIFLPYVQTLLARGADAAITFFNQYKSDTAYFASEMELNELGLELLDNNQVTASLEALKLCTILYPNSWNTYDSYGKALLRSGRKEEAILMYEKSLVMNPQNEPAKRILAEIKPPDKFK